MNEAVEEDGPAESKSISDAQEVAVAVVVVEVTGVVVLGSVGLSLFGPSSVSIRMIGGLQLLVRLGFE